MKNKLLIIAVLCLLSSSLKGQESANFRMGNRIIDTVAFRLDSLSIIPGSFFLQGIASEDYTLDLITATLTILNPAVVGRQITYNYKVFVINFADKISRKPLSLILPKRTLQHDNLSSIGGSSTPFSLSSSDLETTGAISRGISIGNNQDFVLNSALNLQLNGKLSEDWEINANITDKNVPIQPEGNSRTINDFNRIFIQLKYKTNVLINAGDIVITKPNSYFLHVNRQLLGMTLFTDFAVGAHQQLTNQAGGGVAKGKYVKKNISVIEGVQGPYKLTGEQNEIAIVIIAGSERVYIDGERMNRGEENDYVIDYNTGELTFTKKTLISAEKRILVEFEYNNLNYTHYALFSYNEFRHEKNQKVKLNVHFFHEQDIKSQSLLPELDEAQQQFLTQLGNRSSEAWYPQAQETAFNSNEVLYRKIDTLVSGISYQSVYVYSTNPYDTLYRLSFSNIGHHKGNYTLISSSANGRVFQWIAPINGIPQGDYDPVILLNTPKTHQLGIVAAEYNYRPNSGIRGEFAFSNYNTNTFSKNDKTDNLGFALKMDAFHTQKINKNTKKDTNWLFISKLSYEYSHKNFHPIESYREVEFSRIYNLAEDFSNRTASQMLQLNAGFTHPKIGNTTYQLNYYERTKESQALRNELNSTTLIKGLQFKTQTAFLFSKDSIQRNQFLTSYNVLSKTFKKIEIGAKENLEYNTFLESGTQLLRPNSYAFNEALIYLAANDTLPYKYYFSYKNRIDNILYNNVLSVSNIINEANASFEIARLKHHQIKGMATFRNNNIRDSLHRIKSENNFIGSIDYRGQFAKNSIILSGHYEAGRGMEQKKSFTYLKVAAGQGNYTWNDYNGNGIEELNEFEPAQFQDQANYIKVWISNSEYVVTYENQLTLSLQLRPSNVWYNAKGFKKFMSIFSNSTLLRTEQKNSLKNSFQRFNPFQFNIADTALVSSLFNLSNTFSITPPSGYFGIDYVYQKNGTKSLLFYGIESQDFKQHQIIIKGMPHRSISLTTDLSYGRKTLTSNYFASRNYVIDNLLLDNAILWQYKTQIQATISYIFKDKVNRKGEESTLQHQFSLDVNYRLAQKGHIQVNVSYIHIKYQGVQNSTIAYELLEGLYGGHNATWTVGLQANLTPYLRLDITYDGRYSENHKVVHVGNVAIRAHF
ncbi:MAG: hypothetical protein LBV46_01880 [Bacteroidales bacterium]|jgi:hypothetical protein|nr:hypothetical protein [Bacteroidales bacterium]